MSDTTNMDTCMTTLGRANRRAAEAWERYEAEPSPTLWLEWAEADRAAAHASAVGAPLAPSDCAACNGIGMVNKCPGCNGGTDNDAPSDDCSCNGEMVATCGACS